MRTERIYNTFSKRQTSRLKKDKFSLANGKVERNAFEMYSKDKYYSVIETRRTCDDCKRRLLACEEKNIRIKTMPRAVY